MTSRHSTLKQRPPRRKSTLRNQRRVSGATLVSDITQFRTLNTRHSSSRESEMIRPMILMLAMVAVFAAAGCATDTGAGASRRSSDGHFGHSH